MARLFIEGLLLQASLIFALGAQNLFVLESGLRRQYPIGVSFACFLCDLTLIMLGVAGAGTLFSAYPEIKIAVGIIGVIFLFQYGVEKIFKTPLLAESEVLNTRKSLKRSLMMAVSFSILNPHAYLDAFVLIGGYSAKYSFLAERVTLGLGAATCSLLWFLLLSTASGAMKPMLAQPARLRAVMSVAGLCLVLLSFKLSMDVYGWIAASHNPIQNLEASAITYSIPGSLFTSILF